MERLQIVSVELPGLSDEILFDTDELAQALEEEEEEEDEGDDLQTPCPKMRMNKAVITLKS